MIRTVVSTNPDRTGWLKQFVESFPIPCANTLDIIITRHFELGAIKMAYDKGYERFLFLQDSTQIKDEKFFDEVSSWQSALLLPRPSCYMAVYHRRVLDRMWWPEPITPDDKEASITYETAWLDDYMNQHRRVYRTFMPVIFPELTDRRALDEGNLREVNGERRLVLENDLFVKYKGCYR